MIITVKFRNSGITKDMEFKEAPKIDNILTIQENGVDTRFYVLTVSGPINSDGKESPATMTVERIDD